MTDVDDLAVTDFSTLTGLEVLQGWATGSVPLPDHAAWLGVRVSSASFGSVVLRWTPSAGLVHEAGAVRGGFVSLVCDEAATMAAASLGLRYRPMRTLDFHATTVRQVPYGATYTVYAQVMYSGSARIVADARIEDAEGLLVGRATGSFVALSAVSGADETAGLTADARKADRWEAAETVGRGRSIPEPREPSPAVAARPEPEPLAAASPAAWETGSGDEWDAPADGLTAVGHIYYEPLPEEARPVSDGMDLWKPASDRRRAAAHSSADEPEAGTPRDEQAAPGEAAAAVAFSLPQPRAIEGDKAGWRVNDRDDDPGDDGDDGDDEPGAGVATRHDTYGGAFGALDLYDRPPRRAATDDEGGGESRVPVLPTPKAVVRRAANRMTAEHLRPVDVGTFGGENQPPGSR